MMENATTRHKRDGTTYGGNAGANFVFNLTCRLHATKHKFENRSAYQLVAKLMNVANLATTRR